MRLVVGILFWLAFAVAALYWLSDNQDAPIQSRSQLTTFLTKPRQSIELTFDQPSILRVGDPVIVIDSDSATVVGNIVEIPNQEMKIPPPAEWARVEFYSSQPAIVEGDFLTYHQTPASMDWVVQMMLPPYKRQEIAELISSAYRQHYEAIAEQLQPILIQSVKDAANVVREEFYLSINKRKQQIDQLGNRYQVELVEQELVPLIQDEIWPIVRAESQPLAVDIGEEMFQQASVWRFGWRFIYDSSPLPEKNLVQKEFQRFLDKHGIPIIKKHIPEILKIQQRVLERTSANPKVRNVVSETSMKVLRDPEFQRLTTDIMRDVFVDNKRLLETFERNWNSAEAKRAIAFTNQKLDATITKIGQALFGTPEQSITPEFSRILRNRILHKDNRWLVLHLHEHRNKPLTNSQKLIVRAGKTGTENPFHVPARAKF